MCTIVCMNKLDLRNYSNRHLVRSKLLRMAWNVAWMLLARWTPDHSRLFNKWRVFLIRAFGGKISSHCVVKSSCKIWYPRNLILGEYVALSEHVNCYSVDMIKIGNRVTVSREVFLCCASHDIASSNMELVHAPIIIDDDAWVAARAIVLHGRTIGEGAVVAAGSVVVHDVPPWTIVGGNPAMSIGHREIMS